IAMPMAVATMPPSAMGESSTRCSPYLRCRPSVTRNTPPKYPTSSPMTTTDGSRAIITSMAEFRAWIMFICAIAYLLRLGREPELGIELDFLGQLLALAAQALGKILVDVLEHEVAV